MTFFSLSFSFFLIVLKNMHRGWISRVSDHSNKREASSTGSIFATIAGGMDPLTQKRLRRLNSSLAFEFR